jgi:GT2 family glycosyltransferase
VSAELSVLIVSYNTSGLTAAFLESLATAVRGITAEVIVVDNASADDTVEVVRSRFPDVRLIEQEANVGFARAVNVAASRASGEYLLLLNPDMVVLDRAVHALLAFARQNPSHGVYGGRTLRPDRSVDPSSCWGAPTLWSHLCFGLGLSTAFQRSRLFDPDSLGTWQRDTVRSVGVVTGCLLLLPRTLFAELGGFDPRFFMYGEDVDLSMRARAAGWDPVVTPAAEVVHHVGASSSGWADKHVLVMRGKTTLARVHYAGWRRAFCLAMLGLGVALRAALATTSARAARRAAGARVGAGADAAAGDWPALWRRRRDWWSGYPASSGALERGSPSGPGADPRPGNG